MDKFDFSVLAKDILNQGNIGLWIIELEDAEEPRMYGDEIMRRLVAAKEGCSPENFYNSWYNNIYEGSYDDVDKAVEDMLEGKHSEVTYPWYDKTKKTFINVRCGGAVVERTEDTIRLQGYHQDITMESNREILQISADSKMKLETMQRESAQQMKMLLSVANVYFSLHYIDLETNTVSEYSSSSDIRQWVKNGEGAARKMINVIANTVKSSCLEDALKFTDLSTIQQRMKGKIYTAETFEAENVGWFDAEFIAVEQNKDLTPKSVIFATKVVDEQKSKEEKLIRLSHTDGLTGVCNRRSYEEKILEINGIPEDDNFVIISVDVNGLKQVNDNIGHDAGDEVIVATSRILKEVFGDYGEVYRMGGDEFVVILSASAEQLDSCILDCNSKIDAWTGQLVSSISVSIGLASKRENPDKSIQEMAKLADMKMYEAKSAYYVATGRDRRRC